MFPITSLSQRHCRAYDPVSLAPDTRLALRRLWKQILALVSSSNVRIVTRHPETVRTGPTSTHMSRLHGLLPGQSRKYFFSEEPYDPVRSQAMAHGVGVLIGQADVQCLRIAPRENLKQIEVGNIEL